MLANNALTDDMLVAQAQWLPQYQANGSIAAAQALLDAAVADGTRIHRMTDFHGAARLHTKTVEEMSEAQDRPRKNGPHRGQW